MPFLMANEYELKMNRKNSENEFIVMLIRDFLQIGGFCSFSIGIILPKLFPSNSRFRDAM
jgi:hypothetical protein